MLLLAIGDVAGACGLEFLEKKLRPFIRFKGVDFTVVNGENCSVNGVSPAQAERIYAAGADCVTLGNHTYSVRGIGDALDEKSWLLRPANYPSRLPGVGMAVYDMGAWRIKVINLIGRCMMGDFRINDPFAAIDRLLEKDKAEFTVVDFHAEATSEKMAMGLYLDGRVSALYGTHTHVQTADERILPGGTGFISDLGMTGPINSVIGVKSSQSLEFFLGGQPGRFEAGEGPCMMCGALFELDDKTGLCKNVERVCVTQ